jgi:hypothetical protein
MNKNLFEEALEYVKKNLPLYVKVDKTLEDALRYYLNGKTEITEQSIKKWIRNSYSQQDQK